MASYSLQWRASTRKDLQKLSKQDAARILQAVEGLVEDQTPHGSEKLKGSDHTYRIRVGDYRVIYEILSSTQTIEFQRVRHRKDVYRP
jgi:mRNA interferase RelE/StbE